MVKDTAEIKWLDATTPALASTKVCGIYRITTKLTEDPHHPNTHSFTTEVWLRNNVLIECARTNNNIYAAMENHLALCSKYLDIATDVY